MEAAKLILGYHSRGRADAADVHRTVCQDIVSHIGSTRASVWRFSPFHDRLTCACLIDVRYGLVEEGAELTEDEFPAYFAEIRAARLINAPDALRHPATRGLREHYLGPHGVVSTLDVTVSANGRQVAVISCAQCGEPRIWTPADIAYLKQMAVLLRLSVLVSQRPPVARRA
jgi:GAF domain-containing protein